MAPDLLPCGADRNDVVAAALADGPDDGGAPAGHGDACAHCAGARDEARSRWDAARRALATPEPPPPSVAEAVFARVRAARRGDEVALPSEGPGRTLVAAAALAELVRRVARPVAGVGALGDVDVVVAEDGGVAVAVEVEPDLGAAIPLPDVAAALRRTVAAAVAEAAGVAVATVDVTFS